MYVTFNSKKKDFCPDNDRNINKIILIKSKIKPQIILLFQF